jgi:hypothetical protein
VPDTAAVDLQHRALCRRFAAGNTGEQEFAVVVSEGVLIADADCYAGQRFSV